MEYLEQKKSIKEFGKWIPEEDTGCLMIKCPICLGRMIIYPYTYEIPYRFCPYCGEELIQDNLFKFM